MVVLWLCRKMSLQEILTKAFGLLGLQTGNFLLNGSGEKKFFVLYFKLFCKSVIYSKI